LSKKRKRSRSPQVSGRTGKKARPPALFIASEEEANEEADDEDDAPSSSSTEEDDDEDVEVAEDVSLEVLEREEVQLVSSRPQEAADSDDDMPVRLTTKPSVRRNLITSSLSSARLRRPKRGPRGQNLARRKC